MSNLQSAHMATDVLAIPFDTHAWILAWNWKWQCTSQITTSVPHAHTVYCFNILAGPTQSPGTLIRWWGCHCSALPFWSERGWERSSLVPQHKQCAQIITDARTHETFSAFLCCFISHHNCFPLQGLLQNCNSMSAGYLFQPDKQYDVTYDTGDKAIQCGRHVDIFKFWLMWKAKVRICLEPCVTYCLHI